MKITLITFGSPQLYFAKEGIAEYSKRIVRFADFNCVHIKEGKKAESQVMKIIEKKILILLDEKGRDFTTQELSFFLEKQKNQSQHLCFVVGGPDGHSNFLKKQAHFMWSLSSLTFPHDIATMLAIETVYRSLSLLAGHPYHRK